MVNVVKSSIVLNRVFRNADLVLRNIDCIFRKFELIGPNELYNHVSYPTHGRYIRGPKNGSVCMCHKLKPTMIGLFTTDS